MEHKKIASNSSFQAEKVISRIHSGSSGSERHSAVFDCIVDYFLDILSIDFVIFGIHDLHSKRSYVMRMRARDPDVEGIYHSECERLCEHLPGDAKISVQDIEIAHPKNTRRMRRKIINVPFVLDGLCVGYFWLGSSELKAVDDIIAKAKIIAGITCQIMRKCYFEGTAAPLPSGENLYDDVYLHTCQAMLGDCPAFMEVKRRIELYAQTNASVMLIGESGTGKELVAREIHRYSDRSGKPFIPVNCAAIPSTLFESELFGHERGAYTGAVGTKIGFFEAANFGTILLDEISEMPLELQPKLLRVLEERKFCRIGATTPIEIDIRVIAASSIDLEVAINEGTFRPALFHRLNVLPIYLPPLRERREDIPILAGAFIAEFTGNSKRFSPEALELMGKMEWRGNVRELRNTVERISILVPAMEIKVEDLMKAVTEESKGKCHEHVYRGMLLDKEEGSNILEYVEREMIKEALNLTNGIISRAALLLGIERNALKRRMEKYGIISPF